MTIKQKTMTGLAAVTLVAGSSAAFAQNDMSSNSASGQSGTSQQQPQGLYSAEQLMEAQVFTSGNTDNSVGEIEDVLLDNGMQIKSFVVETKGTLGIVGGKSYVVQPNSLSVETVNNGDSSGKPEYRISLDMSREELSQQPVYSDSWWQQAQAQASEAWQDTKQSAQSAWTQVKSTTSNLMSGAQDQASDAANATQNAASNAGEAASNAADNATDTASNAADNATDMASNAADSAGDAASNAADSASNAADNATNNN